MLENQTSSNTSSQLTSVQQKLPILGPDAFAVPEEEPPTALKSANDFICDHKVILSVFVTLGTIFISACLYLYHKGYLDYYSVGNEWNTYTDKSLFYTLALPFCFAVSFIIIVLYQLLPIIKKRCLLDRILFWTISTEGVYLYLICMQIINDSLYALLIYMCVPMACIISQQWILSPQSGATAKGNRRFFVTAGKIVLILLIIGLSLIMFHFLTTGDKKIVVIMIVMVTLLMTLAMWFLYALLHVNKEKEQPEKMDKDKPENVILFSAKIILVFMAVSGICIYAVGVEEAKSQTFANILLTHREEQENQDTETAPAYEISIDKTGNVVCNTEMIVDVVLVEKIINI